MSPKSNDPIITSIVKELRDIHRCHTVVLYGSRARGLATPTSDCDVVGIRRRGQKLRIAKKQKGFFWDVFVYPEKDLIKLGESHFSWKSARRHDHSDPNATRLFEVEPKSKSSDAETWRFFL
jgi:predicted nucleotidyltransferase